MDRPHPALRGTLLVLLLAALVVVPAAPSRAASARLTFLSLNMCGNACGQRMTVVADLEASLSSRQPFAVMLQEVCRGQFDRLRADLPAYRGRFATTLPGRCWDGSDYGIAVLLRTSSYRLQGVWSLPNPGADEPRALLCLRTSVGGASQPLVVCSTHIDFNTENRASQISAVASRTRSLDPGRAVVVGGDFNTTPGNRAIDPMYDSVYPSGTGVFREADSTNLSRSGGGEGSTYNEFTSCGTLPCGSTLRKIDYVFMSRRDFVSPAADVKDAAHSDHAPVWARAEVR